MHKARQINEPVAIQPDGR